MHISFENSAGKVNLNKNPWKIKAIEGLGIPEKTCTVVTYPDIDGQELLSAVTHSRNIFILGDVRREGKYKNEIHRSSRIFAQPGVLKLYAGGRKRKIFCRCASFSAETKDRNAVFQSYVLQFTADFPYFEDVSDTVSSIFLRENLIENEFTLPCIFTSRSSRRTVVNYGDAETVPVIHIYCDKTGTGDGKITLLNHTTGKKFTLEYKMSAGETITVDFANRRIESNMPSDENNNGNLIVYISDDTYLSEFYLVCGDNDIECINYDTDGRISADAEYTNKYIEAVI